MTIKYAKRFVKQLKKLRPAERARFYERQLLFEIDPADKTLNCHILTGKYTGLCSINIGGDLRALYLEHDHEVIIFELIGTHSQLYGK